MFDEIVKRLIKTELTSKYKQRKNPYQNNSPTKNTAIDCEITTGKLCFIFIVRENRKLVLL